jgi:acetolactate synthase-1/2/3 large subunit
MDTHIIAVKKICEIFVSTDQTVEPKAASKKLANGNFVSAPLEDMAPFLPREELKRNMYIPLIDER